MNNACTVLSKQLRSSALFKHHPANAFGSAARRAFAIGSFASIAPIQCPETRVSGWQSLPFPKACTGRTAVHSVGLLHTSTACLKRNPGSGIPPKQKPPPLPPRLADRAKIPFGALSKHELSEVYQRDVDYIQGNEILRMLHERRLNGSLIDKGIQPEAKTLIPSESLTKALQWLRAKYPVDEKEAARRWTAIESDRLEAKYIADAERLGIYKPAEAPRPGSDIDTSKSVIDEFRRYNEQKRIREEKELEKSGKAQASKELALARQETKEKLQLERAERISKRREERAVKGMVTAEGEIPPITMLQRLLYPSLFGLASLAAIAVALVFYTPVQQSDRLFPNIPVSIATVGTIAAVNFAIYLLWHFPPAWRTLNTYFTQVPAYPYAFSVIGNTFSHRTFLHLASNIFVAAGLFGVDVHEDVGRGPFMALYLTGGITGSLFSLFYYILKREFSVYTQGASGCAFAVMTAWAVLTANKPPASPETHAFALDVSRWMIFSTVILSHLFPKVRVGVDWMSHVGGAFVGYCFAKAMMARQTFEKSLIQDAELNSANEHIAGPKSKPDET